MPVSDEVCTTFGFPGLLSSYEALDQVVASQGTWHTKAYRNQFANPRLTTNSYSQPGRTSKMTSSPFFIGQSVLETKKGKSYEAPVFKNRDGLA